jgi:oxygen-dependent protoporphyrinogen oxidase
MLAQKPAALALCEALDLRNRLIPDQRSSNRICAEGWPTSRLPSPSVLGIPTTWKGLVKYDLLSPRARARVACEPFIRRRRAGEDESVAAFFRRRFGETTVATIAAPLLGGIHAGDIDALSIRSLFPRFIDAEAQHGSVLRAYRRHQGSRADGLFRSLIGGMEELVGTLERRLPPDSIRKNAPVDASAPDSGGWRIATRDGTALVRSVILASPLASPRH